MSEYSEQSAKMNLQLLKPQLKVDQLNFQGL